MAITINGSGTITGISAGGLPDGSVTAADIESSLDLSGKTVTLPSGTGGKVLQVVSGTLTSAFTTSSSSYVDTGLSATITPSSTSSKIMVLVTGQADRTATQFAAPRFNLLRGSTSIWGGSGANSFYSPYSATIISDLHLSIHVLDSPSTTSATTYKLQLQSREGLATVGFCNQAANNQIGQILLMEIAG